jgi:hypothetical protein
MSQPAHNPYKKRRVEEHNSVEILHLAALLDQYAAIANSSIRDCLPREDRKLVDRNTPLENVWKILSEMPLVKAAAVLNAMRMVNAADTLEYAYLSDTSDLSNRRERAVDLLKLLKSYTYSDEQNKAEGLVEIIRDETVQAEIAKQLNERDDDTDNDDTDNDDTDDNESDNSWYTATNTRFSTGLVSAFIRSKLPNSAELRKTIEGSGNFLDNLESGSSMLSVTPDQAKKYKIPTVKLMNMANDEVKLTTCKESDYQADFLIEMDQWPYRKVRMRAHGRGEKKILAVYLGTELPPKINDVRSLEDLMSSN